MQFLRERKSIPIGWVSGTKWLILLGMGLFGSLLGSCGGGGSQGRISSGSSPLGSETRKVFEQGKQYVFEKKYPKAIEAFSQVIEKNPQFREAYVWRGIARQESGQKQKALDDFSKAIELDPTDNYALEQRAKLYREMGQMAKAQADEDLAAQLREKNREQLRRNIEEAKKRKKRS